MGEQSIDTTAAEAVAAACSVIEAHHTDPDVRRACAKRVRELLEAELFIRIDAEDFASRPNW